MVKQARLISLRHHVSALGRCMTGLRYQEITTIGTLGYSTRPEPCGQWLNSSEGRNSAADIKTLDNIGEVGHSLEVREAGVFFTCIKQPHYFLFLENLKKTIHPRS